jgi:hypothetical protein
MTEDKPDQPDFTERQNKKKLNMKTLEKLTAAMTEMDRVTPRPLNHEDYAQVAISEIRKLSNITSSDDQDKMHQLILEITVNSANLQYIIDTGKINGNMLMEIGHAMEQYARYRIDKTLSEGLQNLH